MKDGQTPWRPPTRRTFVAMLAAAAAAVVVRPAPQPEPCLRDSRTGRPLWIGHC